MWVHQKDMDFPGGPVVKNPPANAGHMGLIPGSARSHMLWSNKACMPKLLSWTPRAWAWQQEKPQQREAHALQRRVALARQNQRKPEYSNEDPAQPQITK